MNMSEEQRQQRLTQIKQQWETKRTLNRQLRRIKTKIGVYSAKGGVGKTTVAVNLAVYLAAQGFSVGLLDADIDTPNAAKVIGGGDVPNMADGRIQPAENWGVKVVSMSQFQENEEEAVIWRGPMIHNALNQFLQLTDWGDLDFMVVDMPPGTSDAPLTVMQTLEMDGFVSITTPQALALLDAKRSINMIKKLNVEVLGVVENYTGDVFGSGGGKQLAKEMGLTYFGDIALRPAYRDDSQPTVLGNKDVRAEYDNIWKGIKARLTELEAMPDQVAAAQAAAAEAEGEAEGAEK
ncbi:MAG: Mrp/NBP35 family ATP-binding protein [Chloroflexi bacterium]|nr:Mrp/NBP35 family ATP-binding protein [Chloroflexota bacterium]MDA1172906.1 Mrp/NBP35 family ATP-binding protein [Chloroflexota bacterium]